MNKTHIQRQQASTILAAVRRCAPGRKSAALKNKLLVGLMALLLPICFTPHLKAQETKSEGIYIIFDASGSMWQKLADGDFKIAVAKQVLQEFMAGDFEGYQLAFRAYGHRSKGDCRDSELIVPFGEPASAVQKLQAFMQNVNPTGKTPIHYSLVQALNDFGDRSGNIILISDGEETCDADPCELVRAWKKKNVNLQVHVVGLGLQENARAAMQCISEASGTEYQDAASAAELADGLKKIKKQAVKAALILVGKDEDNQTVRIEGNLQQGGSDKFQVTSNARNFVDAGDYVLRAGVVTRNGNLYQPVSQAISVAEHGETVVELQIVRPPSVKATFVQKGKEVRGANVTAYQNDEEAFSFRWLDEVFVDPGTYEFRAKPNLENDLSVTASVEPGKRTDVVFNLVETVKVNFKMVASGSGIWFRQNYELWQDGIKKYDVHVHNGATVLPGTYELHLPDELTPYIAPGIVVTTAPQQSFEVTVPVGHFTVRYQNSDGSPAADKRCFVGRADGRRQYRESGQKYPLPPGTYYVVGWRGNYDRVVFEVAEGKDVEVILKEKP